ncbi:peptidase inhibitor family I36 protein [Actinomyces procaprae]|uniref:peptidase inhibitor family I36 protein n=1 Tax=Actinomyces procaprae TaxID=2560010 RepID=UPI0010A233F0|nr:peptidase inhibitor family I36 protein [Actinomyces procaprae]
MKSKFLAAASVGLLALGAMSLTPASYAAQGDCGSGYTCLWEHSGYQGGAVSFQRYIPDLAQWKLTNDKKANDVASSAKQRGRYEDTCFFKHAYGGGESRRMGRGSSWYNLAHHSFNDVISSGYFTGYRSC